MSLVGFKWRLKVAEWSELQPALLVLFTSENPHHRECAAKIYAQDCSLIYKNESGDQVVMQLLGDQSPSVFITL